MSPRLAVGLMSGTSADGVTAALVSIGARGIRVLRHRTYPYSPALKQRVLGAPGLSVAELSRLNVELGEAFAAAALKIAGRSRPCVIGSHGQTVWHGPDATPPNTLQIAEPAVIAERTGVSVVADFRPRDMAAGGQGAPLVPAFDLFLYGRGPLKAVINIGGISNASILDHDKILAAFDTGPGNALMDEAVRRATKGRRDFDAGGRLAASGKVDERLLARLLKNPFFLEPPPKSLDRSTFGPGLLDKIYPRLTAKALPDALATLAELTARSLWLGVLQSSPAPLSEVVVSGGGALNAHLMRRLRALFSPAPVAVTAIPVMAKEAACFAWLAARALEGRANNAPAATGARGPRILGKIIPS
ncbi:MAG: anhydro-N-acetylmuramic acid kinase [Elusimicrobiota bacterium]|nr:anhydro-N-acetylmuramic acid kinase [Elusimicrobiota bacterium]